MVASSPKLIRCGLVSNPSSKVNQSNLALMITLLVKLDWYPCSHDNPSSKIRLGTFALMVASLVRLG
jgi:hypothetical protein